MPKIKKNKIGLSNFVNNVVEQPKEAINKEIEQSKEIINKQIEQPTKELIDISLSHQFSFTFQESLLKKSKEYMLINKDSSLSLSLRKLIEDGRLLFNHNEINDNNFPLFNKKVKEYLKIRTCIERKNIQIFKSSFNEMETRLEDVDQEYFRTRNIILRHWLFYGLYKNNLIDI